MQDLKLSVTIITYNQKQFIKQTIEGALRQKVDFDYEIIIGDDCSTDGTREILLDYQKKYPNLIKLILHPQKNAGIPGKVNFLSTIYAAEGEYIALLDGDDYWIDPLKLQKQVDFLDANPDYAICFHNVKMIYEDGSQEPRLSNTNQKQTTTFEDMALQNYIYTVSCVFRNEKLVMPEWFNETAVGDWVLHLLNAERGKIGYLDEVMAVYRIHRGSVWGIKKVEENYLKWIPIVKQCQQHFYPRGDKEFSQQLAAMYADLCFAYFDSKRYGDCRHTYKAVLPFVKHLKRRSLLALTNRFLMSFFPRLAEYYSNLRTQEEAKLIG